MQNLGPCFIEIHPFLLGLRMISLTGWNMQCPMLHAIPYCSLMLADSDGIESSIRLICVKSGTMMTISGSGWCMDKKTVPAASDG